MASWQPSDPDYVEKVRASFAKQGLMRHLGIHISELAPGACVLAVAAAPDLEQQAGYFHGGLISALLDTAGGYAGLSLMPAGSEVLSTEFKINFLAPAQGSRLIGRARVLKHGRTLTVTEAQAFVLRDGHERLCAAMLQSLIRTTLP